MKRHLGRVLTSFALVMGLSLVAPSCGSDDEESKKNTGQAGSGGEDASVDSGDGEAAVEAGPDSGLRCRVRDPGDPGIDCLDVASGTAPILGGAVYAISYVYADEDRNKMKDVDNVWKFIGFDVDGQSTDGSSAEHCMPANAGLADSVKTDGDGGIDNAFLKNVAPIIRGPAPMWVDTWNASLQTGSPTLLLRLPDMTVPPIGQDGPPGDGSAMRGLGYTSLKPCTPIEVPDAGAMPDAAAEGGADDGGAAEGGVAEGGAAEGGASDAGGAADATTSMDAAPPPPMEPRVIAVDSTSVCEGDLEDPLWSAPNGTFTDDLWVSGEVPEAIIALPFEGATLTIRLRKVRIEMTISKDRRSVANGTISGVIDSEEIIAQLDRIKGDILPLLCMVPDLFDDYAGRIRDAADIIADGTQDPNETCNGITVGLGFDATLVEVADSAASPEPVDSCEMM